MSIKKVVGKLLKKTVPLSVYKLIANGAIIVPSYYKTIIEDAERYYNLSISDSDEKLLLLMRKYAHVIDKGLHRKDATPGHSKSYYVLLKDAVERLESKYPGEKTILWAKSKLVEYEKLQSGCGFVPLRGVKPVVEVSYDQFENLAKARRSNRDFSDRRITNEDVKRLCNIANWASSSCNKQPIEVFATNDPELASRCLKCCKGGTGFSTHIPSFWVFTANTLGYVWPSEIYLPAVDTCLGVQNVMMAATTLGLSGTLLSWAQKSREEEEELRELLGIPIYDQIIICAVIGYANCEFLTPDRKEV